MYCCLFLVAPGPPSNPSLRINTATSLYLSWEEPEEPNGNITGYIYVCYNTGNEGVVVQEETGLSSDTRSAIITGSGAGGITPFTIYTCSVTASTSAGNGTAAMAMGTSASAGGECLAASL